MSIPFPSPLYRRGDGLPKGTRMTDTTTKAALDEWAAEQTCRYCGTPGPRVEWRLRARPVGTYSLAGVQVKFSAAEHPWLVCDGCGHESEGKA